MVVPANALIVDNVYSFQCVSVHQVYVPASGGYCKMCVYNGNTRHIRAPISSNIFATCFKKYDMASAR